MVGVPDDRLLRIAKYCHGGPYWVKVVRERDRRPEHVGHVPHGHDMQVYLLEDRLLCCPFEGGEGVGRTVDAHHNGASVICSAHIGTSWSRVPPQNYVVIPTPSEGWPFVTSPHDHSRASGQPMEELAHSLAWDHQAVLSSKASKVA
jgi:hypothetical protein